MIWPNEDFFQLKKNHWHIFINQFEKKESNQHWIPNKPNFSQKRLWQVPLPSLRSGTVNRDNPANMLWLYPFSKYPLQTPTQTDQPTHEVSISLPRGCKLFVGDGRVFCLLACCLGVLWLLQFLLVKYTTTIKKKTDCYSMTSKKLLSPLQITFERILHFISCQSNSLSNTLKIQEATS